MVEIFSLLLFFKRYIYSGACRNEFSLLKIMRNDRISFPPQKMQDSNNRGENQSNFVIQKTINFSLFPILIKTLWKKQYYHSYTQRKKTNAKVGGGVDLVDFISLILSVTMKSRCWLKTKQPTP